MRGAFVSLGLILSLAFTGAAAQQSHSSSECREGGDFIRNAALARDKGITREFFVGRFEEDVLTIRAFPAALRWFVHNEEDERFLRAEVEGVFDTPQPSEQHREAFLGRCVARAERLSVPAPNT